MGFCVTIHASGVTWALGRIKRHPEYPRFWAGTWLFILVAAWIVMMHLVEIVVFYLQLGVALRAGRHTFSLAGHRHVAPASRRTFC